MTRPLLHVDALALASAEKWGFAIVGAIEGYERRLLGQAHNLASALDAAGDCPEKWPAIYEWRDDAGRWYRGPKCGCVKKRND